MDDTLSYHSLGYDGPREFLREGYHDFAVRRRPALAEVLGGEVQLQAALGVDANFGASLFRHRLLSAGLIVAVDLGANLSQEGHVDLLAQIGINVDLAATLTRERVLGANLTVESNLVADTTRNRQLSAAVQVSCDLTTSIYRALALVADLGVSANFVADVISSVPSGPITELIFPLRKTKEFNVTLRKTKELRFRL